MARATTPSYGAGWRNASDQASLPTFYLLPAILCICISPGNRVNGFTFKRSSGWVHAAAPAEDIPPRYQRWGRVLLFLDDITIVKKHDNKDLIYDDHALSRINCPRGTPCSMAEIVNKILESVLPELEELERVGIFTEAEIRWINDRLSSGYVFWSYVAFSQRVVVRRRREFEYKLLRKPANKDDFLRAIQVCACDQVFKIDLV